MSIHVAIVRRVRPGCEAEFQAALRDFFQTSFDHPAVLGVSMLVPPPGSSSREFGILRTFATAEERDAFYASALFRTWDQRARLLTEGEPVYRQLHGLEAWFRSANSPPPRWKMALLTFTAVYPLTSLLPLRFERWFAPLHPLLVNVVTTAVVVGSLTWIIMPLLTRALRGWLHPESKSP